MIEEQILDLNNRLIEVKKMWLDWMDAGLGQLKTFTVDFQFFCIGNTLLEQMIIAFEAQNYVVKYTEVKSDLGEVGYEVLTSINQKWNLESLLQYFQMFYEFSDENQFDFEGCGAVLKQD